MKKKIFTLFLFAFLSVCCLTACNSPSNISGEFKKDEYVVSINETIDFLDELSLVGIESKDVILSSSNKNILSLTSGGTFKAADSGQAYIFAKTGNKVIAKTKVSVKYKFSSPQNIQIDENGKLSWDKAFVVIDNSTIVAKEYLLSYSLQGEGATTKETKTLTDNSFTFQEKGIYNISLSVLGDMENKVDGSDAVTMQICNGVMASISGQSLSNPTDAKNQTSIFSWDAQENATYDVYIEGFKLFEKLTQPCFDFDYSRFAPGKSVEITIVANDAAGNKLPTSTTFTLEKLETPVVEYCFDGSDGYIRWMGDENAKNYIVKITGFDGQSWQRTVETADEIQEFLADCDGGAYNVEVMALGDEEGLYLNSETTQVITVAKIGVPNVEVEFVGKSVNITFSADDYSTRYRIKVGAFNTIYDTRLGLTQTVDLSILPVGSYNVEVIALPNASTTTETGAEELTYGEVTSAKVINSNSFVYEYFVLEEFGEIKHSLSENISTISFAQIENANVYELYLEETLLDVTPVIADGVVSMSFADLHTYQPVDGTYTFKVVCGRTVDGQERAVRNEKTKTLTILSPVTEAENQENGYFSWNKAEGDCEYYYEIYKTDANYEILTPDAPALSGTTSDTTTSPQLELGFYYTIRVYTLSTDESNYLDATFVDETAFFSQNFIATRQIESPLVTFSSEDEVFKVTISHVEFGGRYEIFVDGEKDGEVLVSEVKDSYTYTLAFAFSDAKKYNVTVVASCGVLYDSNLYLDSEPSAITVERLAQAEIEIKLIEDVFGRKTNENVVFSQIANSRGVKVSLGSEVVLGEGYTLDVIDASKYGSEFTLSTVMLAVDANGSEYFINSLPKEFDFARALSPSAIYFDNGFVYWTNNEQNAIDSFEAILTLVNSSSSNYYYTFSVPYNPTQNQQNLSYDLQTMIDSLVATVPALNSAYRQAEKLQIEIYSLATGTLDGKYRLPSVYGQTTKGKEVLDILNLEKPVMTFDVSTLTLNWTEEVEGSVYDIYVDGRVAVKGHENNFIALSNLGSYDYLTAKTITVQAFHSAYLDSQISDPITIEQLTIDNTLTIGLENGEYVGTLNITLDQAYIQEVWINGSKENVNYTLGSSLASFNFADFAGVKEFSVTLKAKNESTTNYYLDSETVKYNISNLAEKTIQVSQNGDTILWTDFRNDFIGHSLQPIVYTVKVINGENTYDFVTDVCSLSIEKIEETIKAELSGQVDITILAKVEKDYYLTNSTAGTNGYYGEILSSVTATYKLETAEVSSVNAIEETRTNLLLKQKMLAGIEIVFEDKWADFSGLQFVLTWGYLDENGESQTCSLSYNDNLDQFAYGKTTKSGNNYHLTIIVNDYNSDLAALSHFALNGTTVNIQVKKDGLIDSEISTFEVKRFSDLDGSSVSDEGILTIADTQEHASYFVQLKLSDGTLLYKSLLSSQINGDKTLNLLTDEFFGGRATGAYEISIIAFDENEKVLPSRMAEVITGNKLDGIEEMSIDDNGTITIKLYLGDYTDIVFTTRLQINGEQVKKDFIPTKVEGSDTNYQISMMEIFELFAEETSFTNSVYDFEFTVRTEGSINADWKTLSFNYRLGDAPQLSRAVDLDDDYLVFAYETDEIETTVFSAQLTGLFKVEETFTDEEGNEIIQTTYESDTRKIFMTYSDTHGYWITDSVGSYFKSSVSYGATEYQECFAINLNDLLSEIAYGQVEIKIARVGKIDEDYYQFNSNVFTLYKLNKINDDAQTQTNVLSIDDNILSWSWVQQDTSENGNGKAPSAYYVEFENVIWGTSTRVLVTTASVDLRECGLSEGNGYYIRVKAVSKDTSIIASDLSNEVITMRYTSPVSLEVVDGKIVYNVEEFTNSDFMQDIINYFNDSSPAQAYHNQVGLKAYTSPLYFAPQSLADATVKLKFTSVVEGGVTNVSYYVTMNAVTLFPDITISFASTDYSEDGVTLANSYVNVLQKYQTIMLKDSTTLEAINTSAMIDAISLSNMGICDDAILIDDFGRSLPAGEYMVSVLQTGEYQFVESDYSTATKIYISASPALSLKAEESSEGKTYYTATVTPTYNMINVSGTYSKQLATRYKMQLRYPAVNNIYDASKFINLIIDYSGSDWHISYNGQNIENVISNVAWSTLPKFKINMTNLKVALAEIDDSLIEVNKLLEVNIFTYSQDDGYVVNGKSAKFEVRFLDLTTDKITFQNGDFVVNTGLSSAYQLRIKYKLTSQSQASTLQNFSNGVVKINLDKSGVYEYIVLSLNGSVSSYTMNVASDSYVIKNLYKLNSPTLTTKNNNLSISYNSDDITYMSTLKFNLANDISLKESYADQADSGYYYSSNITSADTNIPYVVGSKNSLGDTIYPSELMAEYFYAYLSGNSGTFTIDSAAPSEGDFLLVFSQPRAIMSSSSASINAMMLPYLGSIALAGGDFYLDDRMVGINAVTDADFTDMSGNIVYEIIVTYYGKDNTDTSGNTLMKLNEATYYSERMYASEQECIAQIVNSSFISSSYSYFTISVTLLGGLHATSSDANAIQTLEGTYVVITNSVYFGPNSVYTNAPYGQQVLRSQTITTPVLTRTAAPFLASGSNGILNGDIKFVINKSLFYTDNELSEAQHTANRINIYAQYSYNGKTVKETVTGTIKFETSSVAGEQNYVFVSVTPSDGLFANATDAIAFYITIYGNSAITSVPLVIQNVYKLPKIDNSYSVILIEDKTYLDFSSYFANTSIVNDSSCYKVVVYYMIEGSEEVFVEEIYYDDPSQHFELYSNATILKIQVQDGQDYSTANPKKLLYSDSLSLYVSQTSSDGLKVTWNPQKMCFEWSWTNGNTDEYEYYVSASFTNGKTESEIVTTNYYMPQNRGDIASGGFKIKARKKTDADSTIYSFSDSVVYDGEDIAYKLFTGGNGSASNPYTISNATDFVNISKRNTADKQFYFKLISNIELNIKDLYSEVNGVLAPIMPNFYGVLDGNGYKITVTSSIVSDLSSEFDGAIVGLSSLKFDKYSSIFYSIEAMAAIKNLYIDYQISYNGLDTSNIMFSPLAAYNYGTVDNVNLTAFAIKALGGSGENNVFVGGLVSINYGAIQNSSNSAAFTYSMAQQLTLNFGYGGICIYNSNMTNFTGSITNCVSKGDKQVTVCVNNNLVYMAGISLLNTGKISTSGNDAALRLASRGAGVTTFTGYFAGITISSNNGTLEYLYNNGVIENTSSYGTFNYGGIAYLVARGTINTLVVTVDSQPIVKSCTTKPTSYGSNYAPTNSGTHTLITTKELSVQTITCSNGSVLSISQTDGVYTATITRS